MRKDRARIQIGEISNFGLLELSRQRLRPSVVENSSELCPQCGGSGRIQSIEVSAIQILRSIEEEGNSDDNLGIKVSAHSDLILHILNKKRSHLNEIETRYNITVDFLNDNSIIPPQKKLEITKNNSSTNQDKDDIKLNFSHNDEEDNQTRKKRGNRLNKRKKKTSVKGNNYSNDDFIENETILSKKTDQKNLEEIPKKKNRVKNTKLSTNKSKNKARSSLKKNKAEVNTKIETVIDKTEIREIKSSHPIEVTKVDNKSSSEKPKKKGWWSK
jgi:Ribonucleases G and E